MPRLQTRAKRRPSVASSVAPAPDETAPEPASDAEPPDPAQKPLGCLGRYRLLELIGSGAMGHVYRAEHMLLGRKVAVKVLHPDLARDHELVERFFSEARAVNLVGHPNIVEVTDFAREPDGTSWFLMEFLEGCDLAFLLRNEPISLQRALAICQQICDALEAVHAIGIIHRDIKPENIYIVQREGRDFVKLLDFGIARLPEPVSGVHETGRGVVMGTPPYIAPEQACALELDHRADLYAVGAVLFELITGRMLFQRSNIHELLEDVAFTPAPAVSAHATMPDVVRDDIDNLVARCLTKDPALRPASASELCAELAAIALRLEPTDEPVATPAEPELQPSAAESVAAEIEADAVLAICRPKWQQRAPWVAAAALLVASVVQIAPEFPQLNGLRARAATTLASVAAAAGISATEKPDVGLLGERRRLPAAPAQPAVASVKSATNAVAAPIEAKVLAPIVVPVQRAQADDGALAAADDDALAAKERSRARRALAKIARAEAAVAESEGERERENEPALMVTVQSSHGELDPDKLLDPFGAK